MRIKEGIVPTILGTVVTATGVALRNTNLPESYRNGLIGFGLANIAIGSAELSKQLAAQPHNEQNDKNGTLQVSRCPKSLIW